MKTFQLPTGETVFVDDADYDLVMRYKWQRRKKRKSSNMYVQTSLPKIHGGRQPTLQLHVFLFNPPKGMHVDHRDGNGLNNTRDNLRILTPVNNHRAFQRKRTACTSRFRGVCWAESHKRWRASIGFHIDGKIKTFNLGRYHSEEDAARAYNEAAIRNGFLPEALNVLPIAI